ncbi:hypothetical protein [Thermoanaerobacterium thermosaccharolyticum]|uniref:hypothetical protein n=1 Tax=Thermoanaerobacterium thermosaccharolyticum TaxID=1517 RepID=UPI002FDB0881
MEKIEIYHQCGHNFKWNIESYEKDKVGSGLIISPVNMSKVNVDNLPAHIKANSFFDPQFYEPRSSNNKLNVYEFFPNKVANGYNSAEYEEFSNKSAELCVKYQVNQNYKYITIPTLYYEEIPNNYLKCLRELYIIPFIEQIKKIGSRKPVLLSVIVKDIQLNDKEYRDELLNFLTGFQEINGIYLIPYHRESSKRIKDIDYIYNLMVFIDILRQNGLIVHLGYTDIEGYLYSLADINSLSIGAYENVRRFGADRFRDKVLGKHPNPPTPRIYSSKLFQWIDYRYLGSLKSEYKNFEDLFDKNSYRVLMFKPEFNWHFTKPELYKHYFISYSNQICSLPSNLEDRYNLIIKNLEIAKKYYNEIDKCNILLDDDSNGSHINYWITAINRFYKYKRQAV